MDFIKDLIMAVGGAVGILLIIAVFCKGIIEKWIENKLITISQKVTLKYSDKLSRHTRAYEMLQDKEFVFYDQTSTYSIFNFRCNRNNLWSYETR